MAIFSDTGGARLSFFGRFTDDLSREALRPDDFSVSLVGGPPQPPAIASYKPDGWFVFQDLKASAADYEVRFESARYQRRSFLGGLPTAAPVELTYGAEDEIYVVVKAVQSSPPRATFDAIPFLPRIRKGSAVRGQGGFATTLREDLEGVDAAAADLVSVSGLAAGQVLRIVRSHSLLAKPGPYYPFPAATTVLALAITSGPGGPPSEEAKAEIQSINTVAPAAAVVDGVELERFDLPGPLVLVLGPPRDLETTSDARGRAVFYFPGHWPITAVALGVSADGHVSRTVPLTLTPGQRTFASIDLTPA